MTKVATAEAWQLRASGGFDPDWYAAAYPDVADSELGPAEHFLWLGARLGRSPLPPACPGVAASRPRRTAATSAGLLDALFIDGTNGGSSAPYRVQRIADGLAEQGWLVRSASSAQLPALIAEDLAPRVTVIHRAAYRDLFPAFVHRMRARGSIIVYDIDDLVFDEALIPFVDSFRHMNEGQQRHFRTHLRENRDFVLAADVCTASTTTITAEIERLGKPAFRVRNSLAPRNVDMFQASLRRPARPRPFTVGYYSGTRTHQADLAQFAPALAQFLRDHDDVYFRLAGAFDLSAYPELAQWQDGEGRLPRVTRVGLMPHDTMLRDQLSCDLIVAPLELGNPFCEAKSELKFFEAALASCPVIASPTVPFVEATQGGRLAMLASSTAEWLAALRGAYRDYGSAHRQAEQAFQHVRVNYSQAAAAAEAAAAYQGFHDWREKRASLRAAG